MVFLQIFYGFYIASSFSIIFFLTVWLHSITPYWALVDSYTAAEQLPYSYGQSIGDPLGSVADPYTRGLYTSNYSSNSEEFKSPRVDSRIGLFSHREQLTPAQQHLVLFNKYKDTGVSRNAPLDNLQIKLTETISSKSNIENIGFSNNVPYNVREIFSCELNWLPQLARLKVNSFNENSTLITKNPGVLSFRDSFSDNSHSFPLTLSLKKYDPFLNVTNYPSLFYPWCGNFWSSAVRTESINGVEFLYSNYYNAGGVRLSLFDNPVLYSTYSYSAYFLYVLFFLFVIILLNPDIYTLLYHSNVEEEKLIERFTMEMLTGGLVPKISTGTSMSILENSPFYLYQKPQAGRFDGLFSNLTDINLFSNTQQIEFQENYRVFFSSLLHYYSKELAL